MSFYIPITHSGNYTMERYTFDDLLVVYYGLMDERH